MKRLTTWRISCCHRVGKHHFIDQLTLDKIRAARKWIVGFSDISTFHGLWTRAGVMSIHGTMSSFLAKGGTDCGTEFKDAKGQTISVEAMLHDLLAEYHILFLSSFIWLNFFNY